MATKVTNPTDKKAPNPTDIYVGARVRARRLMLGMTQTTLGENLGITFQQVQKYEKGTNRIGSSRLMAIAGVLKVPISYFFDQDANQPNNMEGIGSRGEANALSHFLLTREGVALNKAFSRIQNPKTRRAIIGVAIALADRNDGIVFDVLEADEPDHLNLN